MSILYSVVGFILAIGILVAVHEFGHFWVARKLGVKVLRFSVGFGKPLWKGVYGADKTEYVIAAIPLGGYVKMLGEGEELDPIDQNDRHRAFDSQPVWKRSLIVLAGPGINFLFAIVLLMLFGLGAEKQIISEFGVLPSESVVAQAGVNEGDTLLSVDGRASDYLGQHQFYIFNQVLKGENLQLEVESEGQVDAITLDTSGIPIYNINPGSLMRQLGFIPVLPPQTTEISQLGEGLPAEQAGLVVGDVIVAIDGQAISNWRELTDKVVPAAGKPLLVTVSRGGSEFSVSITPKAVSFNGAEVGQLGVGRVFTPHTDDQLVTISRSPIQALGYGIETTWLMSSLTVRMLWKMVTLQVSHKNVNGPIMIADVAGKAIQIGLDTYIYLLAIISISLGVMNLLPIPMLDGGHLLMYTVEIVAGRNMSEKVFAVGQRVGVLLILCLMSLAFYNDIFRLLN